MNMRRITSVLGTVAAAATLALSLGTSAQAANGRIYTDDQWYEDPSGCYPASEDGAILNFTDERAFVFAEPDCQGHLVTILEAGRHAHVRDAASVSIR